MSTLLRTAAILAIAALAPTLATAEERVTFKSAKTTSSYYQMAVQIAEAVKKGTDGDIVVTVEESQGSVQNVTEAARRSGNYVFTTPPVLVKLAQGGKAMFEGKENPKFDEIRALFPIPSLTMHFVMREDAGVEEFSDMKGKTILIGKGSFGAKEGAKYLDLFGLEGGVELANVELNAAVSALKNKQIDGFVTAGSYPAPNVIEAAAGTGISLISMTEEQVRMTARTRLVIPGGTYSGVDEDTVTTSLPVIAHTTTEMSDDTAYALTKAYWDQKEAMGENAKWWNGVTGALLTENATARIHPGALRYYDEQKIDIPDALR
jgi:TRAP transporter TAXI family solute receptor